MCTVSWSRHSNGEFALCFNRDEQHTRADGLPPRIWPGGFLAPVDAAAGGTWLAVRKDGGVLALLNHYPKGVARISAGGSRGAIIPALAVADKMPTLVSMKKLIGGPMNPFRLLALTPDGKGVCFTWSGFRFSTQRMNKGFGMLTSSSWNTAAVIAYRRKAFRFFLEDVPIPTAEALYGIHQNTTHWRSGGWTICMTRDDARTVSLNCVLISNNRVEMSQRLRPRGEVGFTGAVSAVDMPLTAG